MYISSYGPLKFTLKYVQNAKFAVNHTLRWNYSNLITGDRFNFEQLDGKNKVRKYLKVSGVAPQVLHGWL